MWSKSLGIVLVIAIMAGSIVLDCTLLKLIHRMRGDIRFLEIKIDDMRHILEGEIITLDYAGG